jgi:hypothetical protein
MDGIHKFSTQLIDYAERLSDMADAAEGKHRHRSRSTRWLLLPASGAAVYALVRSKTFSRQAKEVVDEAKSRASELPTDLYARVRQVAERQPSGQNGGRARSTSTASRRKSSTRKAKTSTR